MDSISALPRADPPPRRRPHRLRRWLSRVFSRLRGRGPTPLLDPSGLVAAGQRLMRGGRHGAALVVFDFEDLTELGELYGDRAPPRGAMPDNDELDAALREHLALFDDAHPARVARMRGVALALMDALAEFSPHLTGAVWKGIVAEHAPIHLQLFHDDPKDVSIRLLNDGLEFEVGEMPHFRGDGRRADVEAVSYTHLTLPTN